MNSEGNRPTSKGSITLAPVKATKNFRGTRLVPYDNGIATNNFFGDAQYTSQIDEVVNIPNGKRLRSSDGNLTDTSQSTQKFRLKRPKIGQADFDYSVLNLNLKVRDLETKMLDLKSELERKVLQIIEENPKRILQNIKKIEEKETALWADNLDKHYKNNETIELIKMDSKNSMAGMNREIMNLRKQLEDLSYKNIELQRTVGSLATQSKAAFQGQIETIEAKNTQGRVVEDLKNDLRMLKDRFQGELEKKQSDFNDLFNQYKTMHEQMVSRDKEYHNKLRSQKEQLLQDNEKNRDLTRKLEEVRMEKLMGDSEYVKGLIQSLESRIRDEVQKRLAHDFDNKQWMDRQLKTFKDEIKNDEREILENENKFVKEVQETITSLDQIVRNTREQLEANLAATQTMMTENLRNVASTMEVLKDNMFTKMGTMDSSMLEMNKRVGRTVEAFNEHALSTNQRLEKEFGRVEAVNKKVESVLNTSLADMRKRLDGYDNNTDKWKRQFEEKNHSFFKELTNAMKSLKKHLLQEKLERETEDQKLKNSIESFSGRLNNTLKDVEDRLGHAEEVYDLKLSKNNERWESNLQIEVDKLLDAIGSNTDFLRVDMKKYADAKFDDYRQKGKQELKEESADIRDFILRKKAESDEGAVRGIKDLETKLTNKWSTLFDDYRIRFEDALRDFTSLKSDLTAIKKDYFSAMSGLETKLDSKMKRDLENQRAQFVDRLSEQKEAMVKYVEEMMKSMKNEVELAKSNLTMALSSAKEQLLGDQGSLKQELMNVIDENSENLKSSAQDRRKEILAEMELQKRMLIERMNEMNEATKSLSRALVLKEAAGRAKEDEHIIKLFDRKIGNLDKYIMRKIGLTESKLRIEFDRKISDVNGLYEEFKAWVINEFVNVRTESEEFKQEYYTREYNEYLLTLAFHQDCNDAFIEIRQTFKTQTLRMDDIDMKFGGQNDNIRSEIEAEKNAREAEDADIKALIASNDSEFKKYKLLNEETWTEYIADTDARFYLNSLQSELVEDNLFHQMENLLGDIGDLGGKSQDLLEQIRVLRENVTNNYNEFEEEKSNTDQRFENFKDKVQDMDDKFSKFYDTANHNFSIAEESLVKLNNFCNEIDSRMTTEDFINRCCFDDIEQKTANELAVLGQQTDLQSEKLKQELEAEISVIRREIVEDIIPTQILSINDQIKGLSGAQTQGIASINDNVNNKLTEHEMKLENHTKQLEDHSTKLDSQEDTLEDHRRDIRKNRSDIDMLHSDMERVEDAYTGTSSTILMEKMQTQADISELRTAIVGSIGDIFKSIKRLESEIDEVQTSGNDEEPKVRASALNDVKDDLEDLNERFAKLEKGEEKVENVSKKVATLEKDLKALAKAKPPKPDKSDNGDADKYEERIAELETLVGKLQAQLKTLDKKVKDLPKAAPAKVPEPSEEAADEEEEEGDPEEEQSAKKPAEVDNTQLKKLEKDVAALKKLEKEVAKIKTLEADVKKLKKAPADKSAPSKPNRRDDPEEENDEGLAERVEQLEDELQELAKKVDKKGSKVDADGDEPSTDASLKEQVDEIDTRLKKLEKASKNPAKPPKADVDDEGEKIDSEEFNELKERVDELEKQAKKKPAKPAKVPDEDDAEKVDPEEFNELKEKLESLEEKVEELENREPAKEEDDEDGGEKVDPEEFNELKEKLQEMEEKVTELEEKIDNGGGKSENSAGGKVNEEEFNELKEKVDEMQEKIDALEEKGGSEGGDDDLKQQVEEMKEQLEELKEKVEELETRGGGDEENGGGVGEEKIEELEAAIEELKEEIEKLKDFEAGVSPEEIDEIKDRLEKADEAVGRIEEMETKVADLEGRIEGLEEAA